MKNIIGMLTALIAYSSAVGVATGETTVNVVGNLGITTQSKLLEAPFWNEKIVSASNGEIKARFQPWNEMGLKGPEIFRLLGQGVMNIATGQLGHSAGDTPINDATDLAGLSPTIEEFKTVTDSFRSELSSYYSDKLGVEILTMQSFQAQILYCRDEFAGLKDLKGRKVRGSGASQADFVKYFGGIPVSLSFGEVQQGLQQGVIDCAITGTLGGYSAKWHEGAKFLYTLPINWGSGVTAANKSWWNGLSDQHQNVLRTELSKLEDEMWALNAKENEIGIDCNTTGPCSLGDPAGMIRVNPSKEDFALRSEAMKNAVLPGFASRCGEDCVAKFNDTIGVVAGLKID
tara:strand:- start:330 stop:1364 length:1035 start_codon:yes stop_codon:yes gene_type:complete